ncbi:MAG TPA: RyR domain-containing protein [Gammaproteobacteria bacterium]|nr:RyR domain-containing protein [Gammaproteobacteria bacterium]
MVEGERLTPDLEAALELLAARVHEAWVEHRRRRGWQFGSVRDDDARLSPSLVPYEQLSESERELDRVTVRSALEALESLGYRLALDAPASSTVSREHLLAQADRMISQGQPLPAYDITRRFLEAHPNDAAFRLCNARALRRAGALQSALRMLDDLGASPDEDGERRGLLAAIHKEMFTRDRGRPHVHAADHLRRAQQLYKDVFEESAGTKFWHGINAATLALLLGKKSEAGTLARRVRTALGQNSIGDDYWRQATLAEAALVEGRFDQAALEYRKAAALARDRGGDVASTRQNAMLLLQAHAADDRDAAAIEAALRAPGVVLFAGLSADPEQALERRFPRAVENDVRIVLRERLAAVDAAFGFGGAAPGAETLFLELMLERDGGIATAVLPWPRDQFAATHVLTAGASWLRRFESLLGSATRPARVHHVVNASLGVGVDGVLYERFAQQLLVGLARLQAATLGTDVVPVVVWDSAVGAGADLGARIERFHALGLDVRDANVIDVRPMLEARGRRASIDRRPTPSAPAPAQSAFSVMAILFADVEDYSRIPESRLPAFIEYFVGGLANHLALKPYKARNVRRIGDGLLMVFASVRDAGLCALDLVEWVGMHSEPGADGETFWSRLGLPRELRVRVALHAGPVFECVDPLTQVVSFEGAHINYAARIEPVTPGNQVYASEAFAALAASSPAEGAEFVCEYVGLMSLAKRLGEYPLYHLRRRG